MRCSLQRIKLSQDGRRKPAYLGGTTYALGYENGMEIALGVGWLAKKNALIKKDPAQCVPKPTI